MKKQFIILVILIFILLPIISHASDAPTITSISPQIREVGDDSVTTIYGSNFGDSHKYGSYIFIPEGSVLYVGDHRYSNVTDTFITSWLDNKIELGIDLPGCVSFEKVSYDKIYGPCFYIRPEIVSSNINTGVAGDELILNSSWAHNFTSVIPDHKNVLNHGAEVYFNNVKGIIKEISNYKIITTIPKNAESCNIKVAYKHNDTTIEAVGPYLEILQPTAQDDLSAYQQYLQQTKVDQAWNYTHGSSNVIVAVIDDGIYIGHPDLDNNMWINYGETEGNGKDDDGNGYVDDKWGWDFISNSKNMTTLGTHGTMVAGIIGSESNNTTGITGINWDVKLMPIIACDNNGCNGEAIINAIKYAVDNGADIINISLAGQVFDYTDSFNETIKYAFDRNVLVVVATGNGDLEGGIGRNLNITKVSPVCNDDNQNMVLGVGAVDDKNQITSWSNYGSCADIYAPGENIISTAVPAHSTLNDFYDIADGTSFSTPIVSGIAALIKAKYPLIKNTAIRDRIINNSDYQNGLRIVNAYKAISQSFSDSEKKAESVVDLVPIAPINNIVDIISQTDNIIQEEKTLITKIDKNLSKRVSGNILLQVEKNGEGWYVYPDDQKKYYLGRPADAFSIMRNLGLGIKHSELNDYLNTKFPSRLSGKIMLDVEQNGEAYYINPDDLKAYYLSRPSDAFRIMRELGLGITNDDVRKID
ncbi:S8 family serine peptidase, partial [Candidatus Parcubacteria bacterium]|nr:S8 family serine peptidase [Candidatus Parcubacteria bacterium]